MVRIIGKYLALSLIFFAVCLSARVTIEVRSESNVPNHVAVGRPFTLDVVVDEVHGSIQAPTLKGLDGCTARLSGVSSTTINGKTHARYSYTVRIDKLGMHTIGPAIVNYQQQELTSDQVRITVVKDLGIVTPKNKTVAQATHSAFLRLMIDVETPFVGQKMNCTLRFYYQDQSISLQSIGMPELSGFDMQEISKPLVGQAEIDGVQYHYGEWRWDMYPTKAGEFIVPAYHADYDIPLKDNNHFFGGFFMLMGNRADRKRVYSNAITVKVLPLPHCPEAVNAVGSFERISADIKPSIAKEGEGMVLTIDIEGNGNLHAIATPQLIMPDSLKYYDSKSSIIAPYHADELPKKRFEFIVQALKAGNAEIPAQAFTYFDIEKHAYATLHTCPLAVSIMPGAMSAKKDIVPYDAMGAIKKTEHDALAHLNAVGYWYHVDEYAPLPWWLFKLLFLLPFLYGAYPLLRGRLHVLTNNSARLTRRRALKKARKQIEQCIRTGNDKELHSIFVQLLQYRNVELADELAEQWNVFFERIAQAAYAQSDNKHNQELCRMAQQWLERLEKII